MAFRPLPREGRTGRGGGMVSLSCPLCTHSSPYVRDTVVSAAVVFAAMITTVPGWRTVWVNATTRSLWPTWHCS